MWRRLCGLVDMYRCCGEVCYLHLQVEEWLPINTHVRFALATAVNINITVVWLVISSNLVNT